ncbi:MAG: translesion error-prone DNA polymerase V subunit UmuC [Desulfobulbus sp.]|nr:translesion error-prone DNA polymerase V subunit UmuC [Desulfobulbus sp.]
MFALVDCNNFYATCESVFRPDLRGRPVIVLSNNDDCVVARSAEVKALGTIKMGVPVFQIKNEIIKHQIVVFSSNYTLYADMSHRVMRILRSVTPWLEIYSIDEAFVDVRGIPDLIEFGTMVRKTIKQWTGITVAVGMAPTKTLAKLANYGAKKFPGTGGVVDLRDRKRQQKLMSITPVGEIWGVGRRTTKALTTLGIETALQLRDADIQDIRRRFNVVLARTVSELRGTPCIELEDQPSPKQQIVTSRSFGQRITSRDAMRQAISEFAERACVKLRGGGQYARALTVFIQTSRFLQDESSRYANQATGNLAHHCSDNYQFIKLAQQLLEKIWREGYEYNKGGVILGDLSRTKQMQFGLFEKPERDNSSVMEAIDTINNRIGSVRFASSSGYQHWAMRRDSLSPAYTTRWSDLPLVK